jgi:hypothetical protein
MRIIIRLAMTLISTTLALGQSYPEVAGVLEAEKLERQAFLAKHGITNDSSKFGHLDAREVPVLSPEQIAIAKQKKQTLREQREAATTALASGVLPAGSPQGARYVIDAWNADLRKYDLDGNRIVTVQERATEAQSTLQLRLQQRRTDASRILYGSEVVNHFDLNKDGLLEPAELTLLEAAAAEAANERRQTILKKYDFNRSGILDADEEATLQKEATAASMGPLNIKLK